MDMKYKGMTWMGNVYQKFEAMCLEVEDIVCQETAKYVESQVQNVGASVKKFYAEVVQDLLPPSADSIKNEGSALSLEQNADSETCKKPKLAMKEVCSKEPAPVHDPSALAVKGIFEKQNNEVDNKKCSKEGAEMNSVKGNVSSFQKQSLTARVEKDSSQAVHDPSALAVKGVFEKQNNEVDDSKKCSKEGTEMNSVKGNVSSFQKQSLTTCMEKDSSQAVHDLSALAVKGIYEKQNTEVDSKKYSKEGTEMNSVKGNVSSFQKQDLSTRVEKDSSQALLCDRDHEENNLLSPAADDPVTVFGLFKQDEHVVGVYTESSGGTKKDFLTEPKKIAPAGEGAIQGSSYNKLYDAKHGDECSTMRTTSPTSPELATFNYCGKTGTTNSSMTSEVHLANGCSDFSTSSTVHGAESSVDKAADIGISTSSSILSSVDISTNSKISLLEYSRDGHGECISHTKIGNYLSTPETGTNGTSDGDGSESGESIGIGELGMKTMEQFHNAPLDGSCIVVDSKELPFVPHKTGKPRSYKKKIRNAFASRMRSGKKQEYEQLAFWYGDVDHQSICPSLTGDVKLPNDNGESEWELL